MDSEDLLSIGEVSELCHVSVKTLRHYDKVGIIKPVYIDSSNKYRYYSTSQLPFILFVRQMRLKGFTISEILGCFENDDKEKVFRYEKVVALVDDKLAQVEEQLQGLERVRQQYISMKEAYLEAGSQNSIQSGNVKIKALPSRIVVSTRSWSKFECNEMNARVSELIYLVHKNSLYTKGYIMTIFHDGAFQGNCRLDHIESDIEVCWEVMDREALKYQFVREIPAGLYASVFHKGDYEPLVNETYPLLEKWIEVNNYWITGAPIWVYIESIPNSQSRENFLTEIQVPVRKI